MNSLKKTFSILALVLTLVIGFSVLSQPAYAAGEESTKSVVETTSENQEAGGAKEEGSVKSFKAIGAAIVIAIPAGLGALAMGMGIAKSADSVARQPEASGEIRTNLMLGLVFVETAIIYALIVAILIIFVLTKTSPNKVNLFGILEVNPGLIAAFTVTGIILVLALILHFAVIPKFQRKPGKVQLVLEQAVGIFSGLAKGNSPHRNGFLGAYLFTAGCYIFVGTLFELLGLQVVTTSGHSMSLPAPLSDINGAISMGVFSYGVILIGGIAANGLHGLGQSLKEFSLPISMSFRLFGALLSGALVTELVYYTLSLSYVLPVIVAVLFTLLHALIQTYVLTMLTSVFYGEVTEPRKKKK